MRTATLVAATLLCMWATPLYAQAPNLGMQPTASSAQPSEGKATQAQQPKLDEERLEFAKKIIAKHKDKIAPQIQQDILAQRVTLGMNPYEAYLAAGQFYFQVSADSSVWPSNADPYNVMWAQTLKPDNSEIWMTFQTETQFPDKGLTMFKVYFKGGKALSIEPLKAK